MMMRSILVIAVIGCGGSQTAGDGPVGNTSPEPAGGVRDTRTPLERRRDDACEALGPKLTQCAVDDARARLAAGAITQKQFDDDTRPEVQRALTGEWMKRCRVEMSSRQVRVLEVCFREEPACGPLQDCLQNLQPQAK